MTKNEKNGGKSKIEQVIKNWKKFKDGWKNSRKKIKWKST